mgnify:FL=1
MLSIIEAILRYYPEWEPPEDDGKIWQKTLCPFHGESRPSAAVSRDLDGFNCLACGVRGDVISIIRHGEGVNYQEAKRISEGVPVGSNRTVPVNDARKSSRRVPFGSRSERTKDESVRYGIRGRSTPWT